MSIRRKISLILWPFQMLLFYLIEFQRNVTLCTDIHTENHCTTESVAHFAQIIDYIFWPLSNYRYDWDKVNFATGRNIHRKKFKLLSDKSLRYAYKRKIFKDFSTPQGRFTCQKLEKAHWFSDNNLWKKYRTPTLKWAAYRCYNEMKNFW